MALMIAYCWVYKMDKSTFKVLIIITSIRNQDAAGVKDLSRFPLLGPADERGVVKLVITHNNRGVLRGMNLFFIIIIIFAIFINNFTFTLIRCIIQGCDSVRV